MTERRPREANARKTLVRLFAVYGADRRRWPLPARRPVNEIEPAGGTELNRVHNEARQLDRVLDAATPPRVPADAATRAIAGILAGGRMARPVDNVVALNRQFRASRAWPAFGFRQISGLAAMAASLVLGLYVGAAGLADDFIPSALAAQALPVGSDDIVEDVLFDLNEDLG